MAATRSLSRRGLGAAARRPFWPALAVLLLFRSGPALSAERFRFGIDWLAEAEYGGYYQALATGIYANHGLEVEIRQGGPQVNQTQLLLAGRLDASVASNSYLVLNFVQQELPLVAVAAFFQRDPSILLAHPGTGHDSFAALRGKPIMIGADTRAGWWNFLKQKFGYDDSQIRTYTFNLGPFLANRNAVQQGYLGSEPFLVRQSAGFDPVVLSLAEAGFAGYGNLVAVRRGMAAGQADLVRRFVAASAEGWRSYLDGDPAPGNRLIRAANPEMTDALLQYGRAALISHHILEDGGPVGGMTEARWRDFFEQMRAAGLYSATLDWRRAYTLDFVADVK